MQLDKIISEIINWKEAIFKDEEGLDKAINKSYIENKWFDFAHQELALEAIREKMLSEDLLNKWLEKYDKDLLENNTSRTIALIMAGNIPLVGFHDLLSVLVSGHNAQIKLSSKDQALWNFLLHKMEKKAPSLFSKISIVERIKNFDAVIATGSNNSARYFEYYFGKYPNIIRKNRNSIAVINGEENNEELLALGKDIFSYYGLGCRNISHLLVPEGYDFKNMLDLFQEFTWVLDNNKYKNNFDYQLSIMLLNKDTFLQGDAILLKHDTSIASPIAKLHYQFYSDQQEVVSFLEKEENKIQCIVGEGHLDFGSSQLPELSDYADNIDVLDFLLKLKQGN
jgi:hypothetical protein